MSVIRSDTGYRTSFAGAPIVNRYGQVIGILSDAMSVPDQGFSVSVAMNSAKDIIENIVNCALEKTERTKNRDLGFEGVFMTDSMATANGSPVGMYVKSVVFDGILYRLGVCPGDVITSLNGVVLTDIKAFEKAVSEKTESFSVVVYRDNDPNEEKVGEYLEMNLA